MDSNTYFILTMVLSSLATLFLYARSGKKQLLVFVFMGIYILFITPIVDRFDSNKIIGILLVAPVLIAYLAPVYWKAIKNKDD